MALLPTQLTYIEPEPITSPLPIQEELVVATTTVEAEEIKDPELTYPGEECNCYAYVKNRLATLPPMASIYPNSEPLVGSVAVEWFNGIKHVSLVIEVTVDGVWVEESNYNHCKTGKRFIPFTKHSLVGFWVAR